MHFSFGPLSNWGHITAHISVTAALPHIYCWPLSGLLRLPRSCPAVRAILRAINPAVGSKCCRNSDISSWFSPQLWPVWSIKEKMGRCWRKSDLVTVRVRVKVTVRVRVLQVGAVRGGGRACQPHNCRPSPGAALSWHRSPPWQWTPHRYSSLFKLPKQNNLPSPNSWTGLDAGLHRSNQGGLHPSSSSYIKACKIFLQSIFSKSWPSMFLRPLNDINEYAFTSFSLIMILWVIDFSWHSLNQNPELSSSMYW